MDDEDAQTTDPQMSPAKVKPLLFGYHIARLGTAESDVAEAQVKLLNFAEQEGYSLAQVFVERNLNAPCAAMSALIQATRHMEVAAIAVPSCWDLGRMPRVQEETKKRLERETNLPVLVLPQPS